MLGLPGVGSVLGVTVVDAVDDVAVVVVAEKNGYIIYRVLHVTLTNVCFRHFFNQY